MIRVLLFILVAALICGCDGSRKFIHVAPDFRLFLTPESMNAIPGERCVLLVTGASLMPDPDGIVDPIRISASCPGLTATVENNVIAYGEVSEITVIPEGLAPSQNSPDDYTIIVRVTGKRGDISHSVAVPITVQVEWTDTLAADAAVERDRFPAWLAANHPELGIDPSTAWNGTMPAPVLVVSHYLYFNDTWEVHVEWHVMIPPYDWTRIYLRRRFVETAPSLGFEISSRSAGVDPVKVEPEEDIWR